MARPVLPVTSIIQWVLPAVVDVDTARRVALERATTGLLRPADAAGLVKVGDVRPLWVPVWRVDLDMRMEVTSSSDTFGEVSWSRETTHFRGDVAVVARRAFGLGRRCDTSAPLCAEMGILWEHLVTREGEGELRLATAPCVEADLGYQEAVRLATAYAERLAHGPSTTALETTGGSRDVQFVWVPIWWVGYEYRGEASESGEELGVLVLGHSGKVLEERHPSKLRAVAARLRRLLTLDFAKPSSEPWPVHIPVRDRAEKPSRTE